MAKLEYNSAWTADEQTAIAEAFRLSDKLQKALFEQHVSLTFKSRSEEQVATTLADALATVQSEPAEPAEPEVEAKTDEPEHHDAKPDEVIDTGTAADRERAAKEAATIVTAEVGAVIDEGFAAQETTKITPLNIHRVLLLAAKAAGKTLDDYPYPNSKREAGKTVVGTGDAKIDLGNEPYDRYTIMGRRPGGRKDVQIPMSFYATMYYESKPGKALQARRDSLSKALANYSAGKDSQLLGEWKGHERPSLERRLSAIDQHATYAINRLRDAIKHDRQVKAFQAVTEHPDAPLIQFDTEKVGDKVVFLNKHNPVSLYRYTLSDPNNPASRLVPIHSGDVSLAAFWRFDVRSAVAKAGGHDKVTLQDILDTVKREKPDEQQPDKAEGADDWSKHNVVNIRQFENLVYGILPWIDPEKRDDEARVDAALLKRSTEKDGDEFVMSLGKLELAINRAMSVLRERFDNLMMKRASVQLKHQDFENENLKKQIADSKAQAA